MSAIQEADKRNERLETSIRDELANWRWKPVVLALQAFRGIREIHAVLLVAEFGDLSGLGARTLRVCVGAGPTGQAQLIYRH